MAIGGLLGSLFGGAGAAGAGTAAAGAGTAAKAAGAAGAASKAAGAADAASGAGEMGAAKQLGGSGKKGGKGKAKRSAMMDSLGSQQLQGPSGMMPQAGQNPRPTTTPFASSRQQYGNGLLAEYMQHRGGMYR